MSKLKQLDFRNKYGKELFSYFIKFKKNIITIIFLNTIIVIASLTIAVTTKYVLDSVENGNLNSFYLFLFIYIATQILLLFLSAILNRYSTATSTRILNELQLAFITNTFCKDWSEINKYHSGDLLTRMTSDLNSIVKFLTSTIPSLISLFVQFLLAFIIVLQYDPLLGVYGLASAPIVAFSSYYFGKKIKPFQKEINATESKYRSFINESLQNNLIIKVFQNENTKLSETESIQQEKYDLTLQKNKTIIIGNLVIQISYTITAFIAFAWGSYRIAQGIISFGTFMAIMQLISRIQSPIKKLVTLLPQYIYALTSTERCYDFSLNNSDKNIILDSVMPKVDVKIKDLSFEYLVNQPIINKFNLEIKHGDKMAIVGESGVGKTTFLRLLMNLLPPSNGNINLITTNQNYLSNSISFYTYVPQGNTLFSGSIKYNLLLANPEATDEDIYLALDHACAKDFVLKLENKIDSLIGEKGLGLSEGQLQRICIARALLKHSPIILLDEATSALDKLTEEKVIQNICNFYPNKTMIAITHRPSILKYVTKVIDLEMIKDNQLLK